MRTRRPRASLGFADVRSVHVYIYALCEPDTGEIRYVGKSNNPIGRMTSHQSNAGAPLVRDWYRSLLALGKEPAIRILRTVEPGDDADRWERTLIEAHDGPRILNRRFAHRPTKLGPYRRSV